MKSSKVVPKSKYKILGEQSHIRSKKNMRELISYSTQTIPLKNAVFYNYSLSKEEEAKSPKHKFLIEKKQVIMRTYSREDMLRFISGNDASIKTDTFNIPFSVSDQSTYGNFHIILIFRKNKKKIYVLNQYNAMYNILVKEAFTRPFAKLMEITRYKFSKSDPVKFLSSASKKKIDKYSLQDKLLLINEKISSLDSTQKNGCIIY